MPKGTSNQPEEAALGSFEFLQREGQDGEEEMDDGGNADDELDDRDVEVNRLSVKRGGKQGILLVGDLPSASHPFL